MKNLNPKVCKALDVRSNFSLSFHSFLLLLLLLSRMNLRSQRNFGEKKSKKERKKKNPHRFQPQPQPQLDRQGRVLTRQLLAAGYSSHFCFLWKSTRGKLKEWLFEGSTVFPYPASPGFSWKLGAGNAGETSGLTVSAVRLGSGLKVWAFQTSCGRKPLLVLLLKQKR